jgi:ribosomal protein S15P/S13E
MDQEEQKLIDKEFEDLQDRIVQRLIDNGFNNPDSPNYPFFEFWAYGKGDWNTMVTKMANNLTKHIREERKPVMNRAMRRAANKKK